MSNDLDLDRYFERIKWGGETTATTATLAGLLSAHVAHIPFENLNVLLGRGVRLDLAGLQAKLIGERRGGYCFEHATLFEAVLTRLGFAPRHHASRVTVFLPRDQMPRTHMFLSVSLDGACYVVDPGFGPFGCATPVPLDGNGVPEAAPTHRLIRNGALWVMEATREGKPIEAWVSTLEDENPIDFEVANHFVATHPSSTFRQVVLASAVTPQGRVNVMNDRVTYLRPDGPISHQLPDRGALRAVFAEYFGFDLPEIETMRVSAVEGWD